jgi:dipeptidyl aminopeptidase/acylaminoacyl peptidase
MPTRHRLAIAFFISAFAGLAAADPAHISGILEQLASIHSIGEVVISPDGKQVIYGTSITGRQGGADVDVSALWMANAKDGTGAMRLTACPGSVCDEHGAAWSPDGKGVAFVTTDEHDQPQIAIAQADNRGVTVITAAHGPLDTPRWSPDGNRIAFLYSEGAPKNPGPLNPLGRDAGVLSSTVYEQRLAVIPARGGTAKLLGPGDLNVYEFDWSPDGTRFAVTAAHGSGDDNWWIAELDLIDAQSGAVTSLLKPALQMASPRWSGDGKRIAYIGGIMSDEGITGGDVYRIDAAGGDPVDLTPDLAASVQTITWNGSGQRIIATEFAAGEEVLASIDARSGTQRELWRAAEMIWANNLFDFTPGDSGISLSRDGQVSAVIRQSYTSPPEIETGAPGKWRPITRLNADVQRLTGRATNISWKNDGLSIQGMLIEPPTIVPGARYPLLVEAHGGPAYAHYPIFPAKYDSFDAALAHRGYFVFKPNPRGSYGQGERFTRANVKDFGYGDLRDILSGLDAVERQAPIDREHVGIFGWSYGGYMTMWSLTQTDRFKAAVAGAGLSDWLSYYGTNNIDTWMLAYFGAPTLIVAGDRDAEVPITQSYEYWNALRRHGVKTEFVVYPDEGHDFYRHADQIDVMTRVVDWFDANLGHR